MTSFIKLCFHLKFCPNTFLILQFIKRIFEYLWLKMYKWFDLEVFSNLIED